MRAPAVSFARKIAAVMLTALLTLTLVPLAHADGEGASEGNANNVASGLPDQANDSANSVILSEGTEGPEVEESNKDSLALASGLVGKPGSFINSDVAFDGEPVIGSFTVDGLTCAVIDESHVELVGVAPSVTLSGAAEGGVVEGSNSNQASEAGLANLVLPETVSYEGLEYTLTSIDPYAFYLSGVTDVTLPASVNDVDDRAFRSSDVANIGVAEGNPTYSSSDGALYDADQLSLLLIPEGKQGTVRIPKTAEVAEASVFSHCPLVNSISVDAGSAAFASENGLLYTSDLTTLLRVPAGATEVTIREGCTTIAAGALEACANLTTINAPASVVAISPDVATAIPTVSLLATSLIDASDSDVEGEPASQEISSQLTAMITLSSDADGLPQIELSMISVLLPGTAARNLWSARGFAPIKETAFTGVEESRTQTFEPQRASTDGVTYRRFISETAYYRHRIPDVGRWIESAGTNGEWVTTGVAFNQYRFNAGHLWIKGSTQSLEYAASSSGGEFDGCLVGTDPNNLTEVTPGMTWTPFTGTIYLLCYTKFSVSITWNSNGGSLVTGTTQPYSPAAKISLPASPTKPGYTFKGWFTAAAEGTQVTASTALPVSDTTYYAQWTANTITLVWNSQGGSAVSNTSAIYSPTAKVPMPATTTKTGYAFAGWWTDPTRGTQVTSSTTLPTSGKTYYARWTANSYTVEYYNKAGTTKLSSDTGFKYDTARNLAAKPTSGVNAGHTAVGWAASTNQSTATYGFGSSQKNLVASGTKRLYLAETANKITLTWNSQGGSTVASTSATYSPTAKVPMPATTTKAGYTFAGWWTAASGGTQVTSSTALPTSNKTYYAHWSLNPYAITYGLAGGAVSGNPTTYDVTTTTFTLKNPTKQGYIFAGWSGTGLTGSANKTVTIAQGSTGNRAYTAHWEPRISADVSRYVTLQLDILGMEGTPPAQGAIKSLCGEPLKVASVSFSPDQGAAELFGDNRKDVSVEGIAGAGASPGFSFPLDASVAEEADPTKLSAFTMAPLGTLDVAYRLSIAPDLREAILAAIDPARFEQATTPVCSVAYTVALA